MNPPITLSVAAALTYSKTSTNPIIVYDTGANIAANADALAKLGGQLSKIIDNNEYNSKGGFVSAINVANLLVLAPKMLNAFNAPMLFSNVVDTAQNVAASAAALLKLNAQVIGLVVNDTAKNIAGQSAIFTLGKELAGLVIDGTAFQAATTLKGGWAVNIGASAAATLYANGMTGGVIQVSDTGANIAANADALAKLGAQLVQVYNIDEVNYSGGFHAAINVGNVLALAPNMLDNLHKGMLFSNVVDSAKTILANLDALQGLGRITGIHLSDVGTPNLAVTAAKYAADAAVLGKIIGAYNITIAGESVANVNTDLKNSHVSSVGVIDTAAHVAGSLDALQAKLGKISGITLMDGGKPPISVSEAQANADTGVLNNIQSPYLLSVKDSSAAINALSLSAVHAPSIELMLTSLTTITASSPLTLTENSTITNLNLSLINLNGDSINEKVYNNSGVEIDILSGNGTVQNQLLFTNETEAQLHLIGVNPAIVHLI